MFSFVKNYQILTLIFALASLELFSFFGYLHPLAGVILFWLILVAALAASVWRLEYGLLVAMAELFIGSKGYLFSLDAGGAVISIRIALFLIIMAVWLAKKFAPKAYLSPRLMSLGFTPLAEKAKSFKIPFLGWYFFLFIALVIGLVQAFVLRNSFSNIFFDFNAFLYFAYLFPLADVLREKINWERAGKVVIASVSWVAFKTFLIFYIFAHGIWLYTPSAYKWIRDTGVGEITKMDQGFFRIFFQGQIYELLLLVILLGMASWYFLKKAHYEKIEFLKLFLFSSILASVVILSFSRSFWVGGGAGLAVLFGLMIFNLRMKWRAIGLFFLYFIGVMAAGFIFIFILMNAPLRKGESVSLSSLVSERATSEEAAGQSRMELLKPLWTGILKHPIIGSGFGATITYNSKDPRILQNNPTGVYTTFAFEWGYFDLWYKMGILGALAYLGLIGSILLALWRAIKEKSGIILAGIDIQAVLLGVFATLIALSAVHFFTPYLNHPLGIGFVVLSSLFAVFTERRKIT